MPVQADHRSVIAQVAPGGPQNRRAERVDEFAGMHVPTTPERLGVVEALGVAFQHPVGYEHNSVARLQRESLQPERSARLQTEGEIDVEFDLLNPPLPQPKRERVPGVDNQGIAGMEVHAQQLPGDELAHRRMREQRVIGVPRLLAEVSTSTTLIAKAAHQQGREQRRRYLVTGSVGDRNLQRITVEAVVEGVTADGAGGFEPTGDRELPRLAGVLSSSLVS